MGIPRLLIAGTHSGVGKTTIATGIMAALTARGMQVQGFKVGPDYIDPSYHTGATGRTSRNLDTWLLSDNLAKSFHDGVIGADIAIVEGVMGLFDGIKGMKEGGSSAHVAKLLGMPIILIVDVRSMAYSTAAVVHGFATLDPMIKVAGVILNRVGSPNHYALVKEAVEGLGIPVVGHLGKEENLVLPERHLGLVPLCEEGCRQDYFTNLAKVIEQGINLDALITLAKAAVPLQDACCLDNRQTTDSHSNSPIDGLGTNFQDVHIAVARDEAFSFYYQDALDLLSRLGAHLAYFSPLHDRQLPENTSGVIIGGGFPESFLPQLASNAAMHVSLQQASANGIPIYAECGGLMYLCTKIVGFDQVGFTGVGLVPGTCYMMRRLQGMGYRQGFTLSDSVLGPKGLAVRGHEFHYSRLEYDIDSPAFQLCTAADEDRRLEGFVKGNLLASYLHQNFAGNPNLAVNFLQACRAAQRART